MWTFLQPYQPIFVQLLFWIRAAIQVGLLASLIYLALVFMRGTRAAPVLLGIVLVTLVSWFLSQLFGLDVFEYLLSHVPALMAFAAIIIFQPELRRAFAEIGSNPHRFLSGNEKIESTVDKIIDAAFALSEKQLGALMVIECNIGLRAIADTGVKIDAELSSELLVTIFYKNTPLHDGAVIVKGSQLLAATCFLPLTQETLSRQLGTRHRAGVGVTEETDAIAIIVSEETGAVSLAHTGRLIQNVDKARMRRHLLNYLTRSSREGALLPQGNTFRSVFESMLRVVNRGSPPPADVRDVTSSTNSDDDL